MKKGDPADRNDGVFVALRVIPGAGRNAVQGVLAASADGKLRLKLRIAAAPEKGAANAVLLKFLAQRWGTATRDITLISGATDRNKVIHVSGASPLVRAAIERDLSTREGESKQWPKS